MKFKLFFPILLLFLFSACSTDIKEILDKPDEYANKEVTVSGTVNNPVNIVVLKYYEIEDSTGKIMVITKGSVPKEGSTRSVTGKVNQFIKIGDMQVIAIEENEE